MNDANPYRSPSSTGMQSLIGGERNRLIEIYSRHGFFPWLLAYLYPVWLLGSFYLTWLVAWFELGHFPRPMLDDPSSIGGMMRVVYYIPGILLILMPMLAPAGLLASWFHPIKSSLGSRILWRVLLGVLYVVLFFLVWYTLRADPGRVVEWWFD